MTLIFFGSSQFSLAALKACLADGHCVLLAITTPDQKRGRGLRLTPTVVREFCLEKNIPVEAPENLKDPTLMARVRNLQPELFVISSYGKIIPSSWLKIPSGFCLNVHPSLLPKYRGAAPLHWPILNGDSETGISIAEVTSRLDSGDIFYQEKFPLLPQMDSEKLEHHLAALSQKALRIVLEQIKNGSLTRVPQDETLASYARKLTKEDGRLSFNDSAARLDCIIRGLKPWPGSFFELKDTRLLVLDAEALGETTSEKSGTLLDIFSDGSILVAAGGGILRIKRVRPAGKKEMSAADFVRGQHLVPGFVFQ